MIFALASALRLARFNAAIDDDKPKWQSNYFIGMPTPAAAIAVLLPVYVYQLGVDELKDPVGSEDRARLHRFHRLHDGVDDPDLLRQALGRARRARMGDADIRRGDRRRRAAVHLPYETLTALTLGYLVLHSAELAELPGPDRGDGGNDATRQLLPGRRPRQQPRILRSR